MSDQGRKSKSVQRDILQRGHCSTGSGKIIIENHNTCFFNAKPQGRDSQDMTLPLTQTSLAFGITLQSSFFNFKQFVESNKDPAHDLATLML